MEDQIVAVVSSVVKLRATRAGVALGSIQNENPANTTRNIQGVNT